MRAALVDVSSELIAELMHMPTGASVIGASFDHSTNCVVLIIDDPALPEAAEPVRRYPACTVEQVRWDWGIS